MTYDELWKAALGEIELSISKAQFNTWFKNTSILSLDDGKAVINVPNGFAKEWLENKYNIIILRAIHNLGIDVKEIKCNVSVVEKSESPQGIDAIRTPEKSIQDNDQGFRKTPIKSHSKEKITSLSGYSETNLNPRYTFDNFIVGENNELARAACLAVSENVGMIYNPLFIYGGVGLGKTHLLQSIGNKILENDPSKRVLYTTSERFTHELIDSIKSQTADSFKERYRNIDLLIIDDVQFLSGKEKTQYEFFNIFNALYQLNKQIVISSDRPPKAIPTLEERLRSRFEGGMIADISRPDYETRLAILTAKVSQKNIPISDDVLRFIAENITNNIRELEGALNRVVAISEFSQKRVVTLQDAENILKELISSGKKPTISHKDIIIAVCEFYDIEEDSLSKKGRKKEIAFPRQIAMYLMRSELNASYTGIGQRFGGRDHTTALHAFEKISKELEKSEKIQEEITLLKEKIYNY